MLAVHFVVPVAHPLLPPSLPHTTRVSAVPDAVPVSVRSEPAVDIPVTLMVGGAVAGGGVAGAPVPTTALDTLSPPEVVNVTLPRAVAATVGLKRSVTGCMAPGASLNGLPKTTRNGPEDGETAPEIGASLEFRTVNTRSAKPLTLAVPKFTVPVGLSETSGRATAFCIGVRQGLSLPSLSTAVTETRYVVPATSPVRPQLTVCLGPGLGVADATSAYLDPGHGAFADP